MPDPALIGGAIAAVAIVSAAAYAAFSGNSASVDVDSDGDEEVEFGTVQTVETPEDDPREEEYTATENESPTPDHVTEVDDITEVKGIGETRADTLNENGVYDAVDLYYAADSTLTDVDGIGEYTVEQIRDDIGGIDYEESEDETADTDEQ